MAEKSMMIYETGGKNVRFNFDVGAETIWVTQAQMAELFDVMPQTIARHLQSAYKDGELEEERVCRKDVQVGVEGKREVSRVVGIYNLDAIIAVGCRVSSRKATDFRIWMRKVVMDYVVKGVAMNEQRLEEFSEERLREASGVLDVMRRLMTQKELEGNEAQGVREVIRRYAEAFRTLKEYDDGLVKLAPGARAQKVLEAGEAVVAIDQLREEMGESEMFGKLRGDEFEGILRTIYQSFGGEEIYPTMAEKAANLLYFVIKDHPFFDGNKRIAALLFMVFLTRNKFGLKEDGEAKISDRALTALTLMIAESDPREKGLMVAVVCRMLG